MGYWGIGVLGYWGIGVLGYWGIGVLGFWGIGVLGYWGIGDVSANINHRAAQKTAIRISAQWVSASRQASTMTPKHH
jgi:hypothetical protein